MTITIDRQIYDDVCISKAIYSLSDTYTFSRSLDNNLEIIEVTSKAGQNIDESKIFDVLNDFKLRGIINKETKDIKTILFAKAFGDLDE
ncbi:MAG: His-Xaa-Ser system protein HxsD [Bacteroidales bacterium]|nr:His-Xaa-Ser system protein HxsD [Bacteroidales bacterium]